MELTLIWDLLIYADVKGHNNSRFIFLAYYRLFPSDFLSSLYSVAGTLCNIRNELLIIGDLNFKVGRGGGGGGCSGEALLLFVHFRRFSSNQATERFHSMKK